MKKKIIFILVIVIIFCYFQYNYINKHNDSFNIIQYENPNKDIFENMIQEKSISIFTKIQFDFNNNINLNMYDLLNNNNKQTIDKLIKQNVNYYNIPLCINHNFTIKSEKIDSKTHITLQNNYRGLIIQLKGTRKIYIFRKNDKQYLYFNNKNNTNIDFWNQDVIKYPLLNKSQYIEIILRENQMIYIPYKFIYASITLDDSITAYSNSESLLTTYFKN